MGTNKFPVSTQDTLLQGVTLDDLITAVTSNEKEINVKTVTKTYETIVQEILINARETLADNMAFILRESQQK